MRRGILPFLIGIFVLAACDPAAEKNRATDHEAATDDDRGQLVRQGFARLSEEVIIPGYANALQAADALDRRALRFCNPSMTDEHSLLSLRQAWAEVYSRWAATDPFRFGPVLENDLELHIYYAFAKPRIIESIIDGDDPIERQTVIDAGIGAHGIASLEYLLFDYEKNLSDILQPFLDQPRRCDYLKVLVDDLQIRIAQVLDAWRPEGGNYTRALTHAGVDSAWFSTENEAVDQVLSAIYQSIETSAQRRRNDQAFRSGLSQLALRAIIETTRASLKAGFSDLMAYHELHALSQELDAHFRALDRIVVVDDAFSRRSSDYVAELDQYFILQKALADGIRLEIAPQIGVPLTLFKADGDF